MPPGADLFAGLQPQPPDPLLSLTRAFRNDPRPGKIDLGVGVYRDADGVSPVFRAVKAAEHALVAAQDTKAYVGPEGDFGFLACLQPIIFGSGRAADDLFAVQTPGGTGALRLAAELACASRPGARVWLGAPSWPIHGQIFARAGLTVATYRHFDPATQRLDFEALMDALRRAEAGDLFLLHGSCHNPSGADLSAEQWRTVARAMAEAGVVPLLDFAYHGLGGGLEEDALGVRAVFEAVDDALLAYSCDKNFGLYRERTGALFVRARRHAEAVRTNILAIARCAWSMPPDHGAAVVRIILESPELTQLWRDELDGMRRRLREVRASLAAAHPRLAPIAEQHGLFSILPLAPEQVEALRREAGIYMAASGRINVAGLNAETVTVLAKALEAQILGVPA